MAGSRADFHKINKVTFDVRSKCQGELIEEFLKARVQ